jgi:hypothetical protein
MRLLKHLGDEMTKDSRTQIFVSYSHADSEHLARLQVHLRPFEREGFVDAWSDSRIRAGQDWRKEIQAALGRAAVAILLISADFLASDFIVEDELPPLLAAAEREGLQIVPVILKPCAVAETKALSRFQSINDPQRPVIVLDEAETEQLWHDVVVTSQYLLSRGADHVKAIESATKTKPMPVAPADANLSIHDTLAFFREELRDPSIVDDYLVYCYQFIDTRAFMHDASSVLKEHPDGEAVVTRVKSHLSNNGWEGDGVLQLLWLPPFIGVGAEDTWGVCVWHVKQSNNGTSWFASPVPLEFQRLAEQNR